MIGLDLLGRQTFLAAAAAAGSTQLLAAFVGVGND